MCLFPRKRAAQAVADFRQLNKIIYHISILAFGYSILTRNKYNIKST